MSKETVRRLNPPPLPWWTPVAVGAVAGVALLGTGVCGAVWQVNQARYREIASKDPINGGELVATGQQAQSWEVAMWVMLGATGVLGLTTAATLPFTDFDELDEDTAGGAS